MLLAACSYQSDSFTLTCNTEVNYESWFGNKVTAQSFRDSSVFKFENSTLAGYICDTWTDEKIECHISSENEQTFFYKTLKFNRMSGDFVGYLQQGHMIDNLKNTTVWRGTCIKGDKPKF